MPRSRLSELVPAQAPTVFSSPGHWQVSLGGRDALPTLCQLLMYPTELISLSPNVPGGEIRFSGEFDAASEEPLGFILRGVAVRSVQRLRHTGSTRLLSCRRNEIPLFQERLLVWGFGGDAECKSKGSTAASFCPRLQPLGRLGATLLGSLGVRGCGLTVF